MAKRHGRFLLITQQESMQDVETVIWRDVAYEQTIPLPLSWRLWSADCQFLASDDDDPSLSPSLAKRFELARPACFNLYFLHKNSMYRASVSAKEIASKLRNGLADVQIHAEPVGALADDDGTVVGLSHRGMLVSMEPTEATNVFKTRSASAGEPAPIDSHPIIMSRKSIADISGELPEAHASTKSLLRRAFDQASVLASPGRRRGGDVHSPKDMQAQGEGGEEGGEENGSSNEDMNALNNPIVQLLMGAGFQPNTPALAVTLVVALYPLDPSTLRTLIEWQQQHGILPRSKVLTAWRLSRLSGNHLVAVLLRPFAAFVALAAWSVVYLYVAPVRGAADDLVATLHARMPPFLQAHGSTLWHWVLPEWLLRQAAPSFLVVVMSTMLPLALFLAFSVRYFLVFTLRRIVLPMSRQAGVYGMSVIACEALSERKWRQLQATAAERPDLSQGIQNSSWITDDIQERYWHGAQANVQKAKNGLQSSSTWRKKMGVDALLESKQPHFHVMKRAFPHGCLAMSKDGHAVFVMRLGVLHKQYSVLEEANLSNDDMVKHLALVYEYFFTRVDPRALPGGRIINLLDMDGLGIMDMQGKAAKLGNLASKVSEHHYPDRLHRALLINCPGMVNQMWGVVKNMLDKNARDRTSLYTKGDTYSGLQEILEDEDIPKEWGGKREKGLYNDEREVGLFKLVAKNNGCKLEDLAIEDMFEPPTDSNK